MDISNLMKPALARGELSCIGCTTLDEHRKYFEKDAALDRRFQPIIVEEPSLEEAGRFCLVYVKDTKVFSQLLFHGRRLFAQRSESPRVTFPTGIYRIKRLIYWTKREVARRCSVSRREERQKRNRRESGCRRKTGRRSLHRPNPRTHEFMART